MCNSSICQVHTKKTMWYQKNLKRIEKRSLNILLYIHTSQPSSALPSSPPRHSTHLSPSLQTPQASSKSTDRTNSTRYAALPANQTLSAPIQQRRSQTSNWIWTNQPTHRHDSWHVFDLRSCASKSEPKIHIHISRQGVTLPLYPANLAWLLPTSVHGHCADWYQGSVSSSIWCGDHAGIINPLTLSPFALCPPTVSTSRIRLEIEIEVYEGPSIEHEHWVIPMIWWLGGRTGNVMWGDPYKPMTNWLDSPCICGLEKSESLG